MDEFYNRGKRLIRQSKSWFFCHALLFLLLGIGQAHAQKVLIVYDADNAYQKRLLQNLQERALLPPDSGVILESVSGKKINQATLDQKQADLILSLGYNNGKHLAELAINTTVLHALIPQSKLYKLFPCMPDCHQDAAQHSYLILDQPIERRFSLIRLISPKATHIGVLKGSLDDAYIDRVESIAQTFGFTLDIEDTSPRLLGSDIDQLAERVDILLATADPALYNPSTIPEILLTSYRHHVPVLGFSKGFVRAGAIASVVSSLDQFARQIDDILKQLQITNTIPRGVIYPKYYQVVSNRNVARSLNLKFKEDTELLNRIQQRELAN